MTREPATERKPREKPRSPAKPPVGKEDPAFYEALGRAIKVGRTQLGMERKDLAERANVSYAYLSDIETGRGRPGSRSLLAIAEALGRSPAELMHEAELYRTQAGLQDAGVPKEVGPAMAASPPRWFHASTAEVAPPSSRALRSEWRARLEASDVDRREELHALVERLSREDLEALLTIARRLAGARPR